MRKFDITGMHCAACSARVEQAVGGLDGVTSCVVSLLTNEMAVESVLSDEIIIKAVETAGYGAKARREDALEEDINQVQYEETRRIRNRLIISLLLLLPLMYFTMGHMMWGWPVGTFLAGNGVGIATIECLLSAGILLVNRTFFINGWKGVIHKAPNMDTLVALGSAVAFGYSLFVYGAIWFAETAMEAHELCMDLYFESAAMILTLITVGKLLEAKAKGRTTDALKSLLQLTPKTATVERDGETITIPATQVQVGDIFIVKPGEMIPVDGIVSQGSSAVNEAAITGESIPVDKTEGDAVTAATLNEAGFLKCRATRVGQDTTFAKIIQLVSDAASTKAPIAKLADKVSGIFVPVVLGIALVTFLVWLMVQRELDFALARAISVLVISCPCSLGLATPVAIMVGNGVGAKNGILFKTAVSLEETGKATYVMLDKTGTITEGKPVVRKVVTADGIVEDNLLSMAAALESKSEHPLGKAVTEWAAQKEIRIEEVTHFENMPGKGLKGVCQGKLLIGGKEDYIAQQVQIPQRISEQAKEDAASGMTPLFFAYDGNLLGYIAVADVIKPDSREAIARLKALGCYVVMLTGDRVETATAIGKEAMVDEVIAGVLPAAKEAVVRQFKERGKVIMVGDGINDAPALVSADMGLAIGAGADVAIEAADVVLVKNTLQDVAAAIALSRATLRNIKENLFWAFAYNCIGIPLAAGVWTPIFGWTLHPMYGAAAMSLSSFCVVTNALRLNLVKIYKEQKTVPVNQELKITELELETESEEETMEITVKGMMCTHCEAHVKKALEALDGIAQATPDHTTGKVVLTVDGEVSMDAIKAAVTEAGYEM